MQFKFFPKTYVYKVIGFFFVVAFDMMRANFVSFFTQQRFKIVHKNRILTS